MSSTTSSRPQSWRSGHAFLTTTTMVGCFTDFFLQTMVMPVLPFVLHDKYHVPEESIPQYLSGVMAAFPICKLFVLLTVGLASDRFAKRGTLYLFGLTGTLAASCLFCYAPNLPLFFAARAMQGGSCAIVWSVGVAMMQEGLGPTKFTKVFSALWPIAIVGQMVAPTIGGTLHTMGGLNAIFALSAYLIGVDLVFRLLLVEQKTVTRAPKVSNNDTESDPLLPHEPDTVSEADKLDFDVETYRFEKISPLERKISLLPCLRNPRFLVAYIAYFYFALSSLAMQTVMPLAMIDFFHFSEVCVGQQLLFWSLPGLVFGPLAGRLSAACGPKITALMAYGTVTVGFSLLRLSSPGGSTEVIVFTVLIFVVGVGVDLAPMSSHMETSRLVRRYHLANKDFYGDTGPYGQSAALASSFHCVGSTVGSLLAGHLYSELGYGNMGSVLAGIGAIVLCAVWFGMGEPGTYLVESTKLVSE